MGLGLYSKGMHDFVMDELELGFRVAAFLDDETNGLRLPLLPLEVAHWHGGAECAEECEHEL